MSLVSYKDTFDCLVTLIFIFVASILLFPLNVIVPVDRRLGSLLGAVLCMLIVWAIPPYKDVNSGANVDFSVLIILASIMAINFVLLRQKFVCKWTSNIQHMIREDVNRGFYAVSFIALLASPFITNDGLCLMLVNPVLDAFAYEASGKKSSSNGNTRASAPMPSTRVCPTDAFFFMLNIACSANIGSSLTYTGNPQNIIVAHSLSKYMNGGVFCLLMILPATVSWALCIPLLNWYRRRAAMQYRSMHSIGDQAVELEPLSHVVSPLVAFSNAVASYSPTPHPSVLDVEDRDTSHPLDVDHTDLDDYVHTGPVYRRDSSLLEEGPARSSALSPTLHGKHRTHIAATTQTYSWEETKLVDVESTHPPHVHPPLADRPTSDQWDVITAPGIVVTALLVIMILEFTGAVPLAGLFAFASVLVVTGVIFCNYYSVLLQTWWQSPPERHQVWSLPATQARIHSIQHFLEELFRDLDYNLLIIFIGLFVVSGTFMLTEIPSIVWNSVAGKAAFATPASTFCILIYILFACQLIGNVPVVFMAVESMELLPRKAQSLGWLLFAFVSTVAGNFTLVGSAANIIVAEKAARYKQAPVHIDALSHFQYCGPITVACIAVGASILVAEAELFL